MNSSGPVGSTNQQRTSSVHPAAIAYARDVAPFTRPFARQVAVRLRTMAGPHFDGVLLDHGAGTGLVGRQVNHPSVRGDGPVWRVHGLDPSAELLSGGPARDQAPWYSAQVGTAADLSPHEAFAGVASNLVLPFVSDALADLRAMRTRLAPGAPLVVATLGRAEEVEPFWAFWSSYHRVDPTSWHPERYVHFAFGATGVLSDVVAASGFVDVVDRPICGVRRISATRAWQWMTRALPIGFDDGAVSGYRPAGSELATAARAEFMSVWGSRTRWTTTCRLVAARTPAEANVRPSAENASRGG